MRHYPATDEGTPRRRAVQQSSFLTPDLVESWGFVFCVDVDVEHE